MAPSLDGRGGGIPGAARCIGDAMHPDSCLLVWQPGHDNQPAAVRPFRPRVAPLCQGGPSPPVTRQVGIGVASGGHRVGAKGPKATLPPLLAAIGWGSLWRDSTRGGEGERTEHPPTGAEGVGPKRSGLSSGAWNHAEVPPSVGAGVSACIRWAM